MPAVAAAASPAVPAFDRALVAKYDVPGPRYTSYPPASCFADGFGADDHAALLAASRRRGGRLTLYLHLPFCPTRCLFCGCNVVISRRPERASRYLDLLVREMDLVAPLVGAAEREVVQVHWGGGTPTLLAPAGIVSLMAAVRTRFRIAPGCEIGIEIDPRRVGPEHLDALAEAGFDRVSLGVQDLDPEVQRAIGRRQPAELTRRVLDGVRRRGVGSVNVDLIYGLPHQTPESFAATIGEVIRMRPDRVALFNFAYLPAAFPHQRAIDPAALPGPAERLALFAQASAALAAAGWTFIGMDHFALPHDPLAHALAEGTLVRNFQGYSTAGACDLVGLGSSAISSLGGGFAQNARSLGDYTRAIEAGGLATRRGLVLSAEDRLRGEVIQALMGRFRLDKAAIGRRWSIDFDRCFAAELAALAALAADGLVELSPGAVEVTPLGRLLARNVAMVFDRSLPARPGFASSRTL